MGVLKTTHMNDESTIERGGVEHTRNVLRTPRESHTAHPQSSHDAHAQSSHDECT